MFLSIYYLEKKQPDWKYGLAKINNSRIDKTRRTSKGPSIESVIGTYHFDLDGETHKQFFRSIYCDYPGCGEGLLNKYPARGDLNIMYRPIVSSNGNAAYEFKLSRKTYLHKYLIGINLLGGLFGLLGFGCLAKYVMRRRK